MSTYNRSSSSNDVLGTPKKDFLGTCENNELRVIFKSAQSVLNGLNCDAKETIIYFCVSCVSLHQ